MKIKTSEDKSQEEADIQNPPLSDAPNTTTAAPERADDSQQHTHQKFAKPATATKGEKLWHQMTYTGIGYLANLAVSLVIWDYFLTGKGRPMLNKFAKGAGNALKASGMDADKADKVAMTASEMACSPLGGHLTMIPVKYAEDNARYLTHRFNQMFDPNYQYKDLQANWSTPDSELPPLADEPTRNTWGEIALRRGIGWAAVTASGTALNKVGWDVPLQNRTEAVVNKGLSFIPGTEGMRANPTFQRYTKLAALDAYFTVITSAVTALTKQTFGKERENTEIADDAMSIDIPNLTEHSGRGGRTSSIPLQEKSHAATVQAASMADKVLARRHESEGETNVHLGI